RRVVLHVPPAVRQEGASVPSELAVEAPNLPRPDEGNQRGDSEPPVGDVEGESNSLAAEDARLNAAREKLSQQAVFLTYLSGSSDGVDLVASLAGRYAEDKFFAKILDQPKAFKNFHCEGGLIYLHENERDVLCLPEVLVNGRSVREIVISHGHSLLAHLGSYKTLCLLRDHVWWKS
ncbi:hypothetical protein C2E23DRAFT_708513, partial [Lenzites betulinus]